MSTTAVTAPEASAPAPRMLVKHPLPQRLLHWFNAAAFLFLWLTGIGIVTTSGYRVAPARYVRTLLWIFGDNTRLLHTHIAVGLTWFAVMGLLILVDPWGLALRFLRDLRFSRDDLGWFRRRLQAELDPRVQLPPQGAYNAGQKAFGWTALLGGAAIGLSGVLMVVGTHGTDLSRWMVLLHLVMVGLVVAFFLVHFSMAALMSEERPALRAMWTSTVDEAYARHHHRAWYEATVDRGGEPVDARERFGLPRAWARLAAQAWSRLLARPEQSFMSPYAAGVGLGLTVVASFALMGHGLGASGLFSRMGAYGLALVAPDHVAGTAYWGPVLEEGFWSYWLLWALLGVLLGGFVSAALGGRLKSGVDRGEQVSPWGRIALAVLGGALVGFATRFTRGCTSHQALSGGSMLSLGSWVFMFSVFGGGFLTAAVLRRWWR